MARQPDEAAALSELAALFSRNGYVRRKDDSRAASEGASRYKKGDEVRLVAASEAELARIQALLETAGFMPGRPYAQGTSFRQPLYGRREVARFLEAIGQPAGRTRKTRS